MNHALAKPFSFGAARFVSNLLNPVLIATPTFIILSLAFQQGVLQRLIVITISAIFSTAIPAAYVLALKRKGDIADIDITEKGLRNSPYLVSIGSYFTGFCILSLLGAPTLIVGAMLCYVVNTTAAFVINRWWKISVHAIGISGPLIGVLFGHGALTLPFFSLIPLVGWSRVKIRAHTIPQVIAGTVLGLVLTTLQLFSLWGLKINSF